MATIDTLNNQLATKAPIGGGARAAGTEPDEQVEVLAKSVHERLKQTDWKNARPAYAAQIPNLDDQLYADLEALAGMNRDKAIQAWTDNAPSWATPPTYADSAWKREINKLKEATAIAGAMNSVAVDARQVGENGTEQHVGLFVGKILTISNGVVTQKIGRAGETARHSMADLSAPVAVGEIAEIVYKDGKGFVRDAGHTQSRSQAR